MDTEQILFGILREQVCGGAWEKQALTPQQLQALYKLSSDHDLAHIVGKALEKHGLLGADEASANFRKQSQMGIFRYVSLNHELNQICATLETEKIPFLPLKGSVLRAWYAEPWMRSSCDTDILVKEETLEQAISALCKALNYTLGERGDHDISLHSPGGLHLELHYDTIQARYADERQRAVLGKIWDYATPKADGSCHYVLSDDMFYYYHIAHMAKHFHIGGCGIKPFLDIWVMMHSIPYEQANRNALLEEGGLLSFAQAVEQVTRYWFEGAGEDALTLQVAEYVLHGGVYGNYGNRATLGQARAGGRLRYLLTRRVFLRYEYLAAEYPILKKHKFLMPLYQVVRWVRMVFSGSLGRTLREVKINANTDKSCVDQAAEMLKQLKI